MSESMNVLFDSFLEAIKSHGLEDLLRVGASLEDIHAAEQQIGKPLPPSYVQFMRNTDGFGLPANLEFGGGELWSIREVVTETHKLRETFGPASPAEGNPPILEMIAFYGSIFGNWFCFDTTRRDEKGEYMIVSINHETGACKDYYSSFSDWLNGWVRCNFFWRFV